MYFVANGKFQKRKFQYFMEAFNYQQRNYPDKKILYSDGILIELVWDPKWEKISTDDLDKMLDNN